MLLNLIFVVVLNRSLLNMKKKNKKIELLYGSICYNFDAVYIYLRPQGLWN